MLRLVRAFWVFNKLISHFFAFSPIRIVRRHPFYGVTIDVDQNGCWLRPCICQLLCNTTFE